MQAALMKLRENRITKRVTPIAFLLIIGILFAVLTAGRFANPNNLKLIFEQALITGTVATGAVFIFASGNVNIAMGASTALVATLSALTYNSTGSIAAMIGVSLALGMVLMVLCALLSTAFRVTVMFVTVVMMTLLVAIQQTIIGGNTVMLDFAMTKSLKDANFSYILFGLFFLFCAVLFEFTAVGRKLKFYGTNNTCANHSGITKSYVLLLAFAVAGIGVGCGSLMTIVRTGSISTSTAATLNMDCMLAIVLGGMSVFGGSRSFIYSALVGAVTVTVLNNGLLMLGVSATILQGIRGVLFLLLVCVGQRRPKALPAPEC